MPAEPKAAATELSGQLEAVIRADGVRVDERLELLRGFDNAGDPATLKDRLEEGVQRLEEAALKLRREARGR